MEFTAGGRKKTLIKVILVGDSGVGKSSLMQQFMFNKFSPNYKTTIGADFASKDLRVNDRTLTLQVWDTAGQERYQSLGVAFYKGAECCMLVLDITSLRSFGSLNSWKEEFLRHAAPKNPSSFPFVVIGHKIDREDERAVPESLVKKWCSENNNCPYFECSAADNTNITEAFLQASKLATANHETSSIGLYKEHSQKLRNEVKQKKKCAC